MPAIEYNPRGEKRKNTEKREEDRKRINLENDIKEIKRENIDFVQQGRGLKKLYNIVKDCDGYNLRNVMMGLSEDDMYRICVCVREYLSGNLDVGSDNTMRLILDGDRYINTDLIDFASGRYTTEEKKKFLCNGQGYRGDNVVKLVCCHLLPKFIESIDEGMEVNNKKN